MDDAFRAVSEVSSFTYEELKDGFAIANKLQEFEAEFSGEDGKFSSFIIEEWCAVRGINYTGLMLAYATTTGDLDSPPAFSLGVFFGIWLSEKENTFLMEDAIASRKTEPEFGPSPLGGMTKNFGPEKGE